MRSYIKKEKSSVDISTLSADELIARTIRNCKFSRKTLVTAVLCCVIAPVALICGLVGKISANQNGADGMFALATSPIAAASFKKDVIAIPTGTVKANPFLPYRDIGGSSVSDVPKFDLVEPPEAVNENSDAARVMDTIVSGILYDRYSPSAILNIEGNDYLVKKGDVVNNYKVLNIMQDSVTVKLGNNVYKAGIGEILTEGTLNHNDVSNLSKKFGGERR